MYSTKHRLLINYFFPPEKKVEQASDSDTDKLKKIAMKIACVSTFAGPENICHRIRKYPHKNVFAFYRSASLPLVFWDDEAGQEEVDIEISFGHDGFDSEMSPRNWHRYENFHRHRSRHRQPSLEI